MTPSPAAHSDQLAALNAIARIANLDLELRPMLQRVADALVEHFGWEFIALAMVDVASNRFVCEAVRSRAPTPVTVGHHGTLGMGVVGEVARTGRAILLDDVRDHDNYIATMPDTRAELCVPVRHGGKTLAVMNLESSRLRAFHDQLPLLQAVADQIAGAIANARLFDDLRRRASMLEMISEVSKAALEAGDLDALLDRIVTDVRSRFQLSHVAILMVDEDRAQFRKVAEAGEAPGGLPAGEPVSTMVGVVGRAIRLGEPQLVIDVAADPDYVQVNADTVSEYVVPIRVGDQILGAFDLESTNANSFAPAELSVFQTIADQLAGAIRLALVNEQLNVVNTRLTEANQSLHQQSLQDSLTEIANRRRFDEALEVEWRRALRARSPLSLIMIDIDAFKRFNDSYGHQAGDDCLRRVAACLRTSANRAGELVARYGGEEFSVILPGVGARSAVVFAEALRQRVQQLAIPHKSSGVADVLTISLGVAGTVPADGREPEHLVRIADEALYQAKRDGRNRVSLAPPTPDSPTA